MGESGEPKAIPGENEKPEPKPGIEFGDQAHIEGDIQVGDRKAETGDIIASDNAQVNVVAGDLNQTTNINISAGATIIIGQQATTGLQALNALVQVSPEVRQSAISFQTNFESALIQVDVLGDYKDIHDLLHQIQYYCYEPILSELSRFPDDTSLDLVESYHNNLRDISTRLQGVVALKRIPEGETLWLPELTLVLVDLRSALDDEKPEPLVKASRRLKRIIAIQPVRINKGLVDSARNLGLPDLMQVLNKLQDDLQSLNLNPKRTEEFLKGLQALQTLTDTLFNMLDEHDRWQVIDGDIRLVESLIEQDIGELEFSWEDMKPKVTALFETRSEEWAVNLRNSSKNLDEALPSGNPAKIKRAFRGFRRDAGSRFYQVDHDLKMLCGTLRQIGEPLNDLLRSFA